MNFKFVLAFVCTTSMLLSSCLGEQYTPLENHGIFTFQNRHDRGFLTAINIKTSVPPVVTDGWRDMASQKWRATSAYFSTSYQLRPLSREAVCLEFDSQTGQTYQSYTWFGLSDSEYWRMLYVGQGYHIIKNYKTGECLQSGGIGQPVVVDQCSSAPRQQWAIHSL